MDTAFVFSFLVVCDILNVAFALCFWSIATVDTVFACALPFLSFCRITIRDNMSNYMCRASNQFSNAVVTSRIVWTLPLLMCALTSVSVVVT